MLGVFTAWLRHDYTAQLLRVQRSLATAGDPRLLLLELRQLQVELQKRIIELDAQILAAKQRGPTGSTD